MSWQANKSAWLFSALGVVSGLAVSTLWQAGVSPGQAPASASPRSAKDPPVVHDPSVSRFSSLEARMKRLEQREGDAPMAKREPRDANEDADPEGYHAAPDPEYAREQQDAAWQELLTDVAGEPTDPGFAPRASASLIGDLNAMADEHKFSLGQVQCHTTRCSARVTWVDAHEAQAHFSVLAQHPYNLNCTTHVKMDEPAPGKTGPAAATAVYDCGELRAAERLTAHR